MSPRRWTQGHSQIREDAKTGVLSADYTLGHLAERKLLGARRAARFRAETGLADFAWQATWAAQSAERPGQALTRCQGCVILIHGWDGSHAIWEDIPDRICRANPRLFVLAPDVNGFGGSPFAEELPTPAACDPAALISSIQRWIELLRLRSALTVRRHRVLTLVGHSMGGAALFYLGKRGWRAHEVARLAVAPALLLNDLQRRQFYKALGVSIWAGSATRTLDWLKDLLAPYLIEALIGDASKAVKDEHLRIFESTPKGTLAQTFYAMGAALNPVPRRRRTHFQVILGHRDRLVGAEPMLLLLEELGFNSEDIRVVLGDHYLFSVGLSSRRLHSANRELLVRQVLDLHEECRRAQRKVAR